MRLYWFLSRRNRAFSIHFLTSSALLCRNLFYIGPQCGF